jgi:hypothetical protein
MRSISVIGLLLALAACQASDETWVAALGIFEDRSPAVQNGEVSTPTCDSLDGAMCARDGSVLCDGVLEGVNAPAMCPAGGR